MIKYSFLHLFSKGLPTQGFIGIIAIDIELDIGIEKLPTLAYNPKGCRPNVIQKYKILLIAHCAKKNAPPQ